ncbi:signal peptidase I [Paenibacillus nasutitermitis]|uniref:Signal peptidase I n=1 Tax=Paenibacillus nasutitermitis TaxID=1652958 RepID=A0A916ZDD7_9BACL|nr:signal peptidase I [Paenibacillus nasutitermitis]GGD87598.1 signal peptidase I [Paenibacillus nasutitermitis]
MDNYSDTLQEAEQASVGSRKRSKSSSIDTGKPVKPQKPSREKSGWVKEVWDWSRTLIAAVAIVLLFHFFVFNLSTVEGQSMEPTLYEKEWLFVNKYSYRFGSPQLGDVIILKDPAEGSEKKEYLVKRIVGVPGDKIEIRTGQLYRNGELVVERFTDTVIEDIDYGPFVVEKDRYFVMGDNRHARASRDSRSFGTVPETMIRGRADYILWPITKLNSL